MEAMNEATWASPGRGRTAGFRFARDDRLARRATAGDPAAFAEIFRRYNRELGRYCQAILGSREQAEDALQNTIVAAIKALPGETREITLRPWLYRVAYNESISMLRQRRPATALDPELADPGSDPGERTERREGLRALLGDLETLPERQRGALVMRELGDLSFAEIAATFGFSEGAARQAIYEARGALLEMAEGREMECAAIRAEISEHDKRVLRGRRLRAHLRECEGCREFEAAIGQRRAEFAQIAPLAPAAAAGILQSVLGSSAAGGGGLTALGGAAGGSAALKSAAAAVAIVAAGAGTADLT
ncbi:MAG TPA: RNA polymerase sigma factor, partial [Solirubrobacterales bacterium]